MENNKVRHTSSTPCRVCGGHEGLARGQGKRCSGFDSDDGTYVYCSQVESPHPIDGGLFRHYFGPGECRCGQTHGHAVASPKANGSTGSPKGHGSTAKGDRGAIDQVYDYRDVNGKLLFQVVRSRDPKDFRQRRPDGNGNWIWNLTGIERVPYRLPELLAAGPEETVFIAEGEKDVDRLRSLGLVATCNPGGAGKGKWLSAYSEHLRGRKCAILPDNDPAGADHAERVAESLCGIAESVKVVPLPGLPEKGDVSDFLGDGNDRDSLEKLVAAAPIWEPPVVLADGLDDDDPGFQTEVKELAGTDWADRPKVNALASAGRNGKPEVESNADTLIAIARAEAELFQAPDGKAYATVSVDDHKETHRVRGPGFKRWLVGRFLDEKGRGPSSNAPADALLTVEALAFRGPEHPVHLRVAEHEGKLSRGPCVAQSYIDLGTKEHNAVAVGPDGWEVVGDFPVKFRRTSGMMGLPVPERGGSLDDLRLFVNTSDDEFMLAVAWLCDAMRLDGGKTILGLTGPQGSAKSTFSRQARSLIDPHSAPLRHVPKDSQNLMVGATNNYVLAFDNIDQIPPWLSSAYCSLATGGGYAQRTHYENDEETILSAKCPVVLNGITDFVERPDLLDRCVFLHLLAIPEDRRRLEAEVKEAFEAARPRIFGALLDALASGLRLLPVVKAEKPPLPRMADFALLGEAVARGLGHAPGAFLAILAANRKDAIETSVADDPVASAILTIAADRKSWDGSATDIMKEVLGIVDPDGMGRSPGAKAVPKSARAMAAYLKRIAPMLRTMGVDVIEGPRTAKKRTYTIRLEEHKAQPSSSSPQPSLQPSSSQVPLNKGFAPSDDGSDGCDGSARTILDAPVVAETLAQFSGAGIDHPGLSSVDGMGHCDFAPTTEEF